jgi:hypothetical protein
VAAVPTRHVRGCVYLRRPPQLKRGVRVASQVYLRAGKALVHLGRVDAAVALIKKVRRSHACARYLLVVVDSRSGNHLP